MKYVTITYQPFKRYKFTRTISGKVPQKIGELSPKQVIAVARLIQGKIDDVAFLNSVTGIRKQILRKLSEFQRYNLIEIFTPFKEDTHFTDFIIQKINRFSLSLYAPQPKLKGVTFGQFIFADTYFAAYQSKQNKEDLFKFVLSFYLPKNTAFTEPLIHKHLKSIARFDKAALEAIAINYQFVREWLAISYPLVFEKPPAEDPDQNKIRKKKQKQKETNGWLNIFQSLVGDDLTKTEEWANLPVHQVLRHLSTRIKNNKKRR